MLDRSDLNAAVRRVCVLKAPQIGSLLSAAGCVDPEPTAGKRARVRSALEATQRRDGHAGGIVGLLERISEADAAEARRAAALREAYSVAGQFSVCSKVRAQDGFRPYGG
jgi:hypothetical protein